MLNLHIKPEMSIDIGTNTIYIIDIKTESILIKIKNDSFAIKRNQDFIFNDCVIKYYKSKTIAIEAPKEIDILRSNAIKKTKEASYAS